MSSNLTFAYRVRGINLLKNESFINYLLLDSEVLSKPQKSLNECRIFSVQYDAPFHVSSYREAETGKLSATVRIMGSLKQTHSPMRNTTV